MNRRDFLKEVGVGGVSLVGINLLGMNSAIGLDLGKNLNIQKDDKIVTTREFLEGAVLRREDVDRFLDLKKEDWAFFDPELGYRMRSSVVKDGIDGSLTFSNYAKTGERQMINWADRPCRINTYGNSFTQCQQVSNGETWQEYIAAHIGEPIRNFGIGGYGVYQAYRRMLREEKTPASAEYVILNIYDDDHFRSLHRWRWIVCGKWRDQLPKNDGKSLREVSFGMFHANPWIHVRIDPKTGKVVEYENQYSTPESLYKLCDKEYVYETFKDDFVVQVFMAQKSGKFDYPEKIDQLCWTLNITGDMNNPAECRRIAADLYWECALRASQYIVEKAFEFTALNKKKLMIMLSYGQGNVLKACRKQIRFDQAFVDFLIKKEILFVDSLKKHVEDFQCFKFSPEEYIKRYYIGHYNPRGNQFFAFSVKDAIVEWLDPKPPAYRGVSW